MNRSYRDLESLRDSRRARKRINGQHCGTEDYALGKSLPGPSMNGGRDQIAAPEVRGYRGYEGFRGYRRQ